MKLLLLIFFTSAISSSMAQTIPVFPSKAERVKKIDKPPQAKTKTVYVEKATNTATIKFICDADAILYIDGGKKGILKKDIPLFISLHKGEYVVKTVNASNDSDNLEWDYTVSETGIEKIEKIALQSVITQRLDAEAAVIEKQKQKEAAAAEAQKQQEAAFKTIQNIEMINAGNFVIGKYEVTQMQWRAVMGNSPSRHMSCDSCPVVNVTWDNVQEFMQKLNALTGKKYRLPAEAEWEYAAKGGARGHGYQFAGSNDINLIAWYYDNSGGKTHPVGLKQPNELGIYDMTGNVWEWCSDWYDASHKYHVVRGGSWNQNSAYSRVTTRLLNDQHDLSSGAYGFRLAISL